ncbi:MAG: sporulation protein YjcZ [Planctomycetota bacterium]
MRRKLRMAAVLGVCGLGFGAGGCAYHAGGYGGYGGYGYYGGRHCGPSPAAAVVVGTAAVFYAIGRSCGY